MIDSTQIFELEEGDFDEFVVEENTTLRFTADNETLDRLFTEIQLLVERNYPKVLMEEQ